MEEHTPFSLYCPILSLSDDEFHIIYLQVLVEFPFRELFFPFSCVVMWIND
jgi:hypothetical protein